MNSHVVGYCKSHKQEYGAYQHKSKQHWQHAFDNVGVPGTQSSHDPMCDGGMKKSGQAWEPRDHGNVHEQEMSGCQDP